MIGYVKHKTCSLSIKRIATAPDSREPDETSPPPRRKIVGRVLCIVSVCASGLVPHDAPAEQRLERTAVRVVREQSLPQLQSDHLKATLLQVIYPPGGSSKPHTHPCPVVGYVVEGAVRMQSGNEPEHVYRGGDTFYEPPNAVHIISANASKKRRAVFLAYFVCDHEAGLSQPLSRREQEGLYSHAEH